MKKTLSILSLALVVIMMISLVACSGGSGANLTGTYKIVEMTQDGEDLTAWLSLLGEDNISLKIDGNTAVLDTMGETVTLTIDAASQTMTAESGETQKFTVDGGRITMEESGTKMVFEKQ